MRCPSPVPSGAFALGKELRRYANRFTVEARLPKYVDFDPSRKHAGMRNSSRNERRHGKNLHFVAFRNEACDGMGNTKHAEQETAMAARTLMAMGVALLLGGGSAGCATSPVRGTDIVWSVDTAARRITIGDRAFTVTPQTQLYGRQGERLNLYQDRSS